MEVHNRYYVHGHLLRLSPSPPPHAPRQVFLSFSYQASHRGFYISSNPVEVSLTDWAEPDPVSFGFWMDLGLFSRRETAYDHLLPWLAVLPFPQRFHAIMVEKIVHDVRSLARSMPAATQVLPYSFSVRRVSRVYHDDEVLVDTVLRESSGEFEIRNYGMVPTAPEALRLKCVKVKRRVHDENGEEGEIRVAKKRRMEESENEKEKEEEEEENCTICLEEFGEFAAAMPCKHMFHGKCIVKWLKTSHYCPICRFEMPSVV